VVKYFKRLGYEKDIINSIGSFSSSLWGNGPKENNNGIVG
jgi:hypothetical protein